MSMKLFTKRAGITINVSTEAIVRAIVLVVVAVFVLRFVGRIGHELQLIATAAFLSVALNPAVRWLSRKFKIKNRTTAVGIAYLIVLVVLAGFLALVVPPLINQTADFLQDLPRTVSNLKTQDSALSRAVYRYGLEDHVDQFGRDLGNRIGDVPSTLVSTASRVGGTLVSILTVLVLTFMMLVEGPLWAKRIWELTDPDKREHRQELVSKMYRVVTGYVNGQVLIALIAALFAMVALLIGSAVVNESINAVALAGIVFLFGLIPLIGNTLSAVLVVAVCMFASVPLAIAMALYFLLYQQIENVTLQPYIQAKSNQLTPLIVFTAAIVGVGLGGILGAFVAIPAAGCIRVLVEDKLHKQFPTRARVEKGHKK
jgi:predicted PurR-regulated permease PerM